MPRFVTERDPRNRLCFILPIRIRRLQTLPQDIQEKTIRLLARLLRLHADQTLASDQTQEAHDE